MYRTIGSMWGDIPLPVRQEGVTRSLRERGTELLEALVGRAQEADLPIETALETGIASEVVVDRARGVDLVVMGRRGEYADFGSHAVGATVGAVARRSPRPVLVCPRGSDALMRPLVAYDGSDHATRALEIAVEYAETRGCPLHLVCVREELDEARRTLEEACDYARGHAVDPSPAAEGGRRGRRADPGGGRRRGGGPPGHGLVREEPAQAVPAGIHDRDVAGVLQPPHPPLPVRIVGNGRFLAFRSSRLPAAVPF